MGRRHGKLVLKLVAGADLTPEGVFAHLLYTGFASQTELRRAIEEFGHIEQCAWARKMLRGFHA
jgi:hypothetical protein